MPLVSAVPKLPASFADPLPAEDLRFIKTAARYPETSERPRQATRTFPVCRSRVPCPALPAHPSFSLPSRRVSKRSPSPGVPCSPFSWSRDCSPQQIPCSHPWRIASSFSPQEKPLASVRPSASSCPPTAAPPSRSPSRPIPLPGTPTLPPPPPRNATFHPENCWIDPMRMRPSSGVSG